jgi:hypothetical protein
MRSYHALILTAALAATATAPALAQQRATDNGTNANGPITIIKNMLAEDPGVTVRVDGRVIAHLDQADYTDITQTVKAGVNTLTLTWSRPVQQLNFEIAFEPTRNNYRKVLVVNTSSAKDSSFGQPGSKSYTFRIPTTPQ